MKYIKNILIAWMLIITPSTLFASYEEILSKIKDEKTLNDTEKEKTRKALNRFVVTAYSHGAQYPSFKHEFEAGSEIHNYIYENILMGKKNTSRAQSLS